MRSLHYAMAVAAVSLATAIPGAAHHSFAAEFDAAKPVTIRGTINKMDWVNPHSWIYVDVGDDVSEGVAPRFLMAGNCFRAARLRARKQKRTGTRPRSKDFEREPLSARNLMPYHDINPRWAVAWDVTGTGRTAVKWNMGRYPSETQSRGG